MSTIDLFTNEFTIVAGPDGADWVQQREPPPRLPVSQYGSTSSAVTCTNRLGSSCPTTA